MMPRSPLGAARRCALVAVCVGTALFAHAAPVAPVQSLAANEKAAFLATLEALVSIETGSEDREGLDKLSALIADRLGALGGQVELIEPDEPPADRVADTPKRFGRMVQARFTGTGTKKILLIAHMDTVYHRGMLEKQPFRVDGNRACGLGIADDKAGVAVILHTLAILKAMNFRDYGQITVLINADEEIGSLGSRATITRLGSQHDAVFSHEGSPINPDRLALTTAGIGSVLLSVEGRASHAGAAPERGRNALYELAHQILQMRDLSDNEAGIKLNWTMASAGSNRNVIPAMASAVADVRVRRVGDYDTIEQKVRERVKNQLIPDAKVEVKFRRGRPPLELTAAAQALARHAQRVYAEIGHELAVNEVAAGGGTDAAYAALKTKAPVIEGFGLPGFGAHSNSAEYIDIDSIEPRLYLATRMIMDVAKGDTE
jgi:glutamate carboxypeptidase